LPALSGSTLTAPTPTPGPGERRPRPPRPPHRRVDGPRTASQIGLSGKPSISCEYFCNPEFKRGMHEHVAKINGL